MQLLSLLVGAAAFLSPVLAQTYTNCNPLNVSLTCPDDPALGLSNNFVFNTSTAVAQSFNVTAGSINYGSNGAEFVVAKEKDSPTIQSKFYIFFGSVSVVMRAASGQGIISSIVLESDDLDEVDWEFLGGNGTHAESNYFGKGNQTTFDRAIYHPVGSDTRDNFHNYTVDWTAERIEWYIDSQLVRTLPYAAANNGSNFPQTPMTVRMGIWAGGDPANAKGVIEWAGGVTDFTKGPYTMYVQSSQITDYSTGAAYHYSDHTGSWQSIKSIAGNSTVAKTILDPPKPALSLSQKFAALPSSTKLGIYSGAGAAGALLISAFIFTFVRQRRAGRRERDAYNAKVEKDQEEAYKDQMELREKGLGGWDSREYATQGDDALGGWGGTHVPAGTRTSNLPYASPSLRTPGGAVLNDTPSRINTPGFQSVRSQSPSLVSPIPQSPRAWNGGNEGGMIHGAGNAYSGAFGGRNSPMTPGFVQSPTGPPQPPPQQFGYPRGYSNGGYHRF